jgi:hypothetical protein
MAKLYGGLKSPKMSSLRAVGTVPAATGGGGGGNWWEAKQASLTPDPYWDDVAFLFQPNPGDVNDSPLEESLCPDRKNPSWNWVVNRLAGQNSARTNTYYTEFEALNWAPMGAGFFMNSYGNLYSEHNMQDVDLIQDWTLEIVYAHDPSHCAVPHGSGSRTYGIPNTDGYNGGVTRSSVIRNGGPIYVRVPSGGGDMGGHSSSGHDGTLYSSGWGPQSQGLKHEMICYDHSASKMALFVNGIMCTASPKTSVSMSTYNQANAVCASVGHPYNATTLSAMAGWGMQMSWTTGYRLTLADRYGVWTKSEFKGLPGMIDMLNMDLTFPERGA